MEDLDLQDKTRRDDTYVEINNVIDSLGKLNVFPSLVWVLCWDIVRNWYENEQWTEAATDPYADECFAQDLDLKTIWDKFWSDADDLGLSLEYGVEVIDESLRDWLRENNFLVALDEDGWLDEPIGDNPV